MVFRVTLVARKTVFIHHFSIRIFCIAESIRRSQKEREQNNQQHQQCHR